jgi:hypothetical protein
MTIEAKLIALLLFLLAMSGGVWYSHYAGYEQAKTDFDLKIAKANLIAKTELDAANEKVSQTQTALNSAQAAIISKSQEVENGKQAYEDLHTKYVNGAVRMSVTALSQSNSAGKNSGQPAAPGISENVQLMPDVSAEVLSFAREYSENLRMKNECIDLYNAVLTKVNGQNHDVE